MNFSNTKQMQEHGDKQTKSLECSDCREREQEDCEEHHKYPVLPKCYGCSKKNSWEQTVTSYCRVETNVYESTAFNQYYQGSRNNIPLTPTFSSPPNSPLIGLIFDPSSNTTGHKVMADRLNSDRRSSNSWCISHQEPIGTGAKKKIVKSQDKRNAYSCDPRFNERIKDTCSDIDRQKRLDRHLTSESTSSLDFYVEGEKMVSDLCTIPDLHGSCSGNHTCPHSTKSNQDEDRNKQAEIFLTALDKIVIHDQIPNQIVQLAIEACTDAENIAIAHHNRPCFKNIHSICAKTRSNVQKPDSAVANLHSQGIPWVIKNFIFSFVRILDGWKGVKELLSEKHDTFSRIENKYYSENVRECFVQWQAVTKEMLTHIYKTFKCLDHGFTLEQKSFTHNYYATNSAAPRHQNQSKFQPAKGHPTTPRPVSASPQPYNALQPPWVQSQMSTASQNFHETQWPNRSGVTYKKVPVMSSSSQNFYSLNDTADDSYQKSQQKCDPCNYREAKPRQSWTITNVADFRALESIYQAEQRELYAQLKHKIDAELCKPSGQTIFNNMPSDILHRRDMELKAKMIPLSHVEKTLIPSMATSSDIRGCYMPKNNSCGDTKDDADFFAAWGQMIQKEHNDFLTHHTHSVQASSNVLTNSNNIAGPVQFIEYEHDEFHEMSKVYMKPGSYKVPIKPSDSISQFMQNTGQDNVVFDTDDNTSANTKNAYPAVVLAPQPKYNIESWPCLMSKRAEEIISDKEKPLIQSNTNPGLDMHAVEAINILSSVTSDKAWEAAKQSAPKLLDFINVDSKSDTARLYNALGLNASDNCTENLSQVKLNLEPNNDSSTGLASTIFMPKTWEQTSLSQGYLSNPDQNTHIEKKEFDKDNQTEISDHHEEETKSNNRCPNFDQCGNYVRDVNQKKNKSKVAVPGMWYHPKKKKPLPLATVKKFETIIAILLKNEETAFIQRDMDIKIAPRFYEVIKYPMCLHDISTKLNNSSYTDYEQVVQDFRRIFNNVRLYLKSCPDPTMKRNINKIAAEFEELLNDEFQNKLEPKSQDNCDEKEAAKKKNEKDLEMHKTGNDVNKKNDVKTNGDNNNI